MDSQTIVLLVAVIGVLALIAYVVWRNDTVRTWFKVGPAEVNIDTQRKQNKPAAKPAPPGAELEAGNIRGSQVTNRTDSGGARLTAEDIDNSTVINESSKPSKK